MRKYYTKIEKIAGNVAVLKATDVGFEELAVVEGKWGTSMAQVIKVSGNEVSLQVFAGTRGVSTGDKVSFLGAPMRFSFSDNLFGRIFSGGGEPLDGRSPLTDNLIEVGGPAVNPAVRLMPHRMIRTNIPMIDVFNTLVEGQKLPIFSIPGEPYNELLARIALQAEADVIIVGCMGLKFDEYLFLRRTLEAGGAMSRTVMFVHTASDPVVECLLTPDIALTVAERFAVQGKRVLCLLTDFTNFANALKEIAITMEQIPSNRGYPGDLYSQLAARYEKAVVFGIGTLGNDGDPSIGEAALDPHRRVGAFAGRGLLRAAGRLTGDGRRGDAHVAAGVVGAAVGTNHDGGGGGLAARGLRGLRVGACGEGRAAACEDGEQGQGDSGFAVHDMPRVEGRARWVNAVVQPCSAGLDSDAPTWEAPRGEQIPPGAPRQQEAR